MDHGAAPLSYFFYFYFSDSPVGYFQVIITDLQMPVMDGYETAAAIRSLKRQDVKTIPIIAMTANAFSEAFSRITEVGMNAHITKPIEPKVLWNTLKSFIS